MKKIIVCSDGTWNKPNNKDGENIVRTNVEKIFNLIERNDKTGVPQIKLYDQGVGSDGNMFTRMFNGATGIGVDENIKDVYKFISWNYVPGDEIYLFGFSRGAYTARSVAGFIRKAGILKLNDLRLLDAAYDLYRNISIEPKSSVATSFRAANCYDPAIKFIGVWDTVGALGIPLSPFELTNKKKYLFHDTTLSSIIDYAYHAVAIDEQRKTFEPTLWVQSSNVENRSTPQVFEQRWFPGVHSNVGGGYPDEGLADISLDWMIDRANKAGLHFDETLKPHLVKPNYEGNLYDSHGGIFSLMPRARRAIELKTALLDESVKLRREKVKGYDPENLR